MNVALDRPALLHGVAGRGDHLTSGIILAPSLGYMDRAYARCPRAGLEP